jgi:Mg/Co/Ni transporter MgtE
VGDLGERVRAGGWDLCVVIDQERVVLGLVLAEALSADPATPVEEVMDPGPVTFRPNLRTGELPHYLTKHRIPRALVTTSDGVLIGLLPLEDFARQRPGGAGGARHVGESARP